jgi:hypothetical protein
MSPAAKYILAWIILPFIAILNGLIREFVYREGVGESTAHQISSITLIILISLYVRSLNDKIEIQSKSSALFIGAVWLVLTIAFEFVMGYVILQKPISTLLDDYNILKGRLWCLVLIWVFLAPLLLRNQRAVEVLQHKENYNT